MSVRTPSRIHGQVTMSSASSGDSDPAAAVAELSRTLGDTAELYAVFVAPGYDLELVGRALRSWCPERIIGCTSAGNIGPQGYTRTGITAISLSGGGLRARTIPVGELTGPMPGADRTSGDLAALHDMWDASDGFAVLLVDGLSKREDRLAALLMAALGDVPIIGGSAGGDLGFNRTAVFCDGHFVDNGATLTMVALDAPFELFRVQHCEPTEIVLVATDATPHQRIIRAFNGRPAAQVYAEAIGHRVEDLGPEIFSTHPLMLLAAGGTWVRSISGALPDGSFNMLAAVDVGDVLRIGRPVGILETLDERLSAVSADLGDVGGVLAFDCVLRRLEFEARGSDAEAGRLLAGHRVAGFSTYGEQFNGMHMNQTMVAVAFGAAMREPERNGRA
jgi:hypothetical protein